MRALPAALFVIRRAIASDSRPIRELSQVSFGEYDPSAARTTANMMREPGARTLVAERDGKRLGFIILRRRSGQPLAINAIAVTPSERGTGVGKRLMQAAEHYARSHGISRIGLCTAQANLAALDLFLRRGFVITGRTTAYYWRGQPACWLEKRL
jgi:[ribosomal protein S18]-alanine N-acetyltransferase